MSFELTFKGFSLCIVSRSRIDLLAFVPVDTDRPPKMCTGVEWRRRELNPGVGGVHFEHCTIIQQLQNLTTD
jgi:hypothetical protein